MTRRALFLTPIFDPQVGGASVHFKQLSTGMVDRGAIDSFIIITSSAPEAPIYERIDHGRIFRVLFSPKSIQKRWSKQKVVLNYLSATLFTILAILLYRVSLVHTHTRPYFSLPVRVAKMSGRPVIVDGRDLGAPSFGATGSVFVCASRNIEEKARTRDETIRYIPIGIDPEELDVSCENVQTPSDPYLLYVGDIATRKGVPELLAAHGSGSMDKQLVLIGECIDTSMDFEGRELVTYLGTLPHNDVLCYIRDADLVVLPSKEEALGRVILEAKYHGTPFVCPPGVPEYSENLPDNTLTSVTATDIQNKIEKITNHNSVRGGYDIERHFLPNVLSEYHNLYDNLQN